jgi:diguanylate cyclase (GGDEF)-like protein
MVSPRIDDRSRGRLMVFSAAAMYGAAAAINLVEGLIPGGPPLSPLPGLVSLVLVVLILTVGLRLPPRALAPLGPVGVGLIAVALATSPGPGDGAVLYVWPVLWSAYFFGRLGAISVVGCTAVAHAAVLSVLPAADGYGDRWVDVMVTVSVIAGVVHVLARKNDALLATVTAEARTDRLTGVLNRRGLEEQASRCLAQARREGSPVAVVIVDIDYFKRVNDQWGHEVGDRVIAHLGSVLADECRETDVVARLGGEEFVVLLSQSDEASALLYTRRVRRALAESDRPGRPAVRISAGAAAATAPADVAPLLQSADTALYEAKRTGRDRTVLSDFTGTAPLPGLLPGGPREGHLRALA